MQTLAKENWKIVPQKTALVIVDMQRFALERGSFSETQGARELVPRINELTDMCRRLKIPVIYLCQSNRADLSDIGLLKDFKSISMENQLEHLEGKRGVELYPGLNVAPDDYIVTKIRYSAFILGSSNLEPLLRGLDRDIFIICGTAIEGSVFLTAADGMMLGFKVFCVSDLTGNTGYAKEFEYVMGRRIAKVMTFEEIRNELNRLVSKKSAQA
jgi:ureidoacrylate peracid hydrolase